MPSLEPLRFLHTGDLHLDSPVGGLSADRAARAAASVREPAARRQVLYFTCHPCTAELLDADGARTMRLG